MRVVGRRAVRVRGRAAARLDGGGRADASPCDGATIHDGRSLERAGE